MMNVLDMERMNENLNAEFFHFIKQLNIEDIKTLEVEPHYENPCHYTDFHFIAENGTKLIVHYANNEKAVDLHIEKENEWLFLYSRRLYEEWINYIWEQLVDYFNLRIHLMFINKNMPWRWELEYVK